MSVAVVLNEWKVVVKSEFTVRMVSLCYLSPLSLVLPVNVNGALVVGVRGLELVLKVKGRALCGLVAGYISYIYIYMNGKSSSRVSYSMNG